MPRNPFEVVQHFEDALCEYTGAPQAVAFDSQSSAMEACLLYDKVHGKRIGIPNHTYMSVPACLILTGNTIEWIHQPSEYLTGPYLLQGTRIWDSALRFTHAMYVQGSLMCLSFTGPYKHLNLGKGGMVLCTTNQEAEWFKRYRFNGRNECSYHEDTFTHVGRNCYMLPEIAAKGLRDMAKFYNIHGEPKNMEDLTLPYPDLSNPKHTAYK